MGHYTYNGERWYHDVQPLLKRLRRWVVSTGLEAVQHDARGYTYRWDAPIEKIRRSIRSHPGRSRLFGAYSALCPISLFGGRITLYPFGIDVYRRRVQAWYCLHYRIANPGPNWRKQWYAYRARDATPAHADRWYFGTPLEVTRAAQQHGRRDAA